MERDPGRATFVAPAPLSAHALVHPLLSHVAAIAAWWYGRESLHAGAYVVSDGVWALVGGRGAGKSTTLSWLAREGSLVVCDDMLVLKGDRPFAGPRAIDLRRSAAERFGDGESLGVLGERERWRVPLEALASLPRLKGFVHLAWGDEVRVRPLRAQRRVELLMANRGVRLPAVELDALIELASLAWYELERPQQWDALPRVADELRRLAGDATCAPPSSAHHADWRSGVVEGSMRGRAHSARSSSGSTSVGSTLRRSSAQQLVASSGRVDVIEGGLRTPSQDASGSRSPKSSRIASVRDENERLRGAPREKRGSRDPAGGGRS